MEGPVALGGIKQRATLGFLLLNANRVVATSRLIEALWPTGAAPVTARKILQNAVWGLRGVLSSNRSHAGSAALVTQTPGYMLRVEVDDVDLHVFQQKFAEGRAELLSGTPERAARILKQALELWRGPILSDLVEAGLSWPELATAENLRLDALEDYFQAELDCGRHRTVLGHLEAQVEKEPLKEGFAGQLMTALYRCGRQAEALNVYGRVRQALVEELGLEPGHTLQALQQAILNQDSSLQLPVVRKQPEPAFARHDTAARAQGKEPVREQRTSVFSEAGPTPPPPGGSTPVRGAAHASSVLLVRADLDGGGGRWAHPERTRELVAERIHDSARRFSARVTEYPGNFWLVTFDNADGTDPEEHAVRAVRTAVETIETGTSSSVRLSAAVATGDETGTGDVDTLTARCLEILGTTFEGGVRVCDKTWEIAGAEVGHAPGRGVHDHHWTVRGARPDLEGGGRDKEAAGKYQPELLFLSGLLSWVRQHRTPHLVTLLWESEHHRDHFLSELERCASQQAWDAQILMGRAFDSSQARMTGAPPASCVGALPGHPSNLGVSSARYMDIERLVRTFSTPPGGEKAPETGRGDGGELWGMLRHCLLGATHDHPMVTVFDDLHHAADPLLEFVEELGEGSSRVPLLVIALAHTELLRLRPGWGGGAPASPL